MTLPLPLHWLWSGWKAFSHVFGMIMSRIILTILWIVAFGIYALVLKIGNLFTRKSRSETYWVDAAPDFKDSMKYQF